MREAGFSLHAATRAGAADEQRREALLKYISRPPLSTERLLPGPDGLVRIALKKPFSDGTVAVDLEKECAEGWFTGDGQHVRAARRWVSRDRGIEGSRHHLLNLRLEYSQGAHICVSWGAHCQLSLVSRSRSANTLLAQTLKSGKPISAEPGGTLT